MNYRIICIFFLSFNSLLAAGMNDSSAVGFLNNFTFNVSGYQKTHYDLLSNDKSEVVIPNYLIFMQNTPEFERRELLPDKIVREISDNPLMHAAAYINFDLGFKGYGFSIATDLVAEHRGMSYGVYNTKCMVVFPKYRIEYDTSFSLFGSKFQAGLFTGNEENLKLYEGLTVYNLDCQSSGGYIRTGNVGLTLHGIGDLYNWIGLNLDAILNAIISVEDIDLPYDFKLNIHSGITNYLAVNFSSSEKNNIAIDLSANIQNDFLKLYSDFAIRGFDNSIELPNRSAFLAGISSKYEDSRFNLDFTGEFRWYGYFFNKNFIDDLVSYREPQLVQDSTGFFYIIRADYDNTVGDNLYPLSLYERPFSQWAVFTQYQNKNVIGLIFRINSKYYIIDNLFAQADFDLNYIKASYEPSFWFPFYNIGLGWEPFKNNYIMLSVTNKAMNLDTFYPTFYIYDLPKLMVSLHYNFDLIGRGK